MTYINKFGDPYEIHHTVKLRSLPSKPPTYMVVSVTYFNTFDLIGWIQ